MARLHRLDTSGLHSTTDSFNALAAGVHGFANGVERRRQNEQAQARLALAQREMALREKALQRGLDKEGQVQEFSRKLGEFSAWTAGDGDMIQQQGPPAPAQEEPPGGVGPMRQPAGQLGQARNVQAIDAKLTELARGIVDEKTRDAFLETVAHERKVRHVGQAKDSLAGTLRNQRLQKAYRSSTIDGEEDPSSEQMVADWEKQLSEIDPEDDPEAGAALIDKIEGEDKTYRASLAKHNFEIKDRIKKDMNLEAQIAARETPGADGQPMADTREARQLQEMWKAHLIDDKELAKALPDALNGTLALKAKNAELENRVKELELEKIKAEIGKTKAETFSKSPFGVMVTEGARGARQMAVEKARADAKAKSNGNGGDIRKLDRLKLEQDEVKSLREANASVLVENKLSEAQIRKQARANVDAMIDGESGGAGSTGANSAEQVLGRIEAGEFTSEEELQSFLKSVGLTEADIDAAAKSRKK